MNTGVFACLVMDGAPAAKAGVRFGDQILQIDGKDMAGMSVDKVHKIFKSKNPGDTFELAVRDRYCLKHIVFHYGLHNSNFSENSIF